MSNTAIIVTCRNNESTIEKTIDSILSSSVLPKQLIIIDNYSTDSSFEKIFKKLNIESTNDVYHGIINDIVINILRKPPTSRALDLNIALAIVQENIINVGILDGSSWYENNAICDIVAMLDKYSFVVGVITDFIDTNKQQRAYCRSFNFVEKGSYDSNFFIKYLATKMMKKTFDINIEKSENEFIDRLSKIGLIYHIPKVMYNSAKS